MSEISPERNVPYKFTSDVMFVCEMDRLHNGSPAYQHHLVFSTSDSSSDVLMLSKVRNLEASGADRALIVSETLGGDREGIGMGSGADPPSHVMSLSQSEPQNREGIRSRSPLERASAPKSHVIRSGSHVIAKLIDQIDQMCHKSLTSS